MSQARLLCAIRQNCDPQLRMRISLMLDMTDDEEFETNVTRLIHQLKLPPKK
jgi:hypothetical protein